MVDTKPTGGGEHGGRGDGPRLGDEPRAVSAMDLTDETPGTGPAVEEKPIALYPPITMSQPLDLTNETPGTGPAVEVRPFDLDEAQEKARQNLAYLSFALLVIVVVAGFAGAIAGRWEDMSEYFALVFGAVVSFTTAATFFYFAKK